jgi:hypothetical protein
MSGEEKSQYVVSSSGHAAHPNDIIASCNALKAYIQKMQDDADRELKEWDDAIAARELAEKRRVAPGWLDSDARILEPERKPSTHTGAGGPKQANLMDVDVSSPAGQGDELDRAFGGMAIGDQR